ncbi:MAG TPA: hypothetical protein PLF71_01290 [bacterium]|nr:MAG: hypothetical protein BWY14_00522 [Parcubacteria group bacterium ADurb.Bin192]HPN14737.1 hypothetical protein [bacterium]
MATPYRRQRKENWHTLRVDGEEFQERQIILIDKYHLWEGPGVIELPKGVKLEQVKEEGDVPEYQVEHFGLYIHLRDGVTPDKNGVLRGRIEVNERITQICRPKPSADEDEEFDQPDYDGMTKEEFLAIPEEELDAVTGTHKYLSINVFPLGQDEEPRVKVRILKGAPPPKRNERRRADPDGRESKTSGQILQEARQRGAIRSFGPDKNEGIIIIDAL